MPDLSLWNIEAELANLLDLREEMAERGEDLTHMDVAIREYVAREVRKVDNIRGYLKHCEMMAGAAKAERDLQATHYQQWLGRMDRLMEACQFVMEAMSWQNGKSRRLDGKTGSLLLKTNGGAQAVVITKPELIPEELVQYEGRISGEAWAALAKMIYGCGMTPWFDHWKLRQDMQMERIPHKGRIAQALSAKCLRCNGSGNVLVGGPPTAACSFGNVPSSEPCPECDGDGKARVPGAHLAARENHVEVK